MNQEVAVLEDIYQEETGRLVIEIEAAPPTGNWKAETEWSGYTGSCYYIWRGPDIKRTPGVGVLAYTFHIENEGEYFLSIHNRHDHENPQDDNDSFVKVDDGEWRITISPTRGEWTWGTRYETGHNESVQASNTFTKGVHTIYISGRSKNFAIDRLVFFKEGVEGESVALPVSSKRTHL